MILPWRTNCWKFYGKAYSHSTPQVVAQLKLLRDLQQQQGQYLGRAGFFGGALYWTDQLLN
jgi:hypothetical protein